MRQKRLLIPFCLRPHLNKWFGLHFGKIHDSLSLPLSECMLHFFLKSLLFILKAGNLLLESPIFLSELGDFVVVNELLLALLCLQLLELVPHLGQILVDPLLLLKVFLWVIRVLLAFLIFLVKVAWKLTFGLYWEILIKWDSCNIPRVSTLSHHAQRNTYHGTCTPLHVYNSCTF